MLIKMSEKERKSTNSSGCSSEVVVKWWPNIYEALGSIPNTLPHTKKLKVKEEWKKTKLCIHAWDKDLAEYIWNCKQQYPPRRRDEL
jgi:hypothetical protein